MKIRHLASEMVFVLWSALVLVSCGGGGGSSGGGVTPSPTAPSATISGAVTAPGGAIAFNKRRSFGDFFESDAYAALTGLVAVPDGTIVQLARFNATGTNFTLITTTTTSGGRYSFDLDALGVQPANDLIVRVAGSNGREMRAFVVGTIADISPVSEAACQLVIQSFGTGSFNNFTLQEVSDVVGGIALIAMTQDIGAAVSVSQAVALVSTAVGANASFTAFIAAAAQAGQTSQGSSDIGNFFPFEQGNIWRYQGTRSLPSVTNYDTTVLVSGQGPAPISGVNSTIFSETNSQGDNRAEKDYGVKTSSGIVSNGNDDPSDNISRQLAPFQSVHFPLTPGTTTVLSDRAGLDWGEDEDGDGRNETVRARLIQAVQAKELVIVPAGTFSTSLRIEFKAVFVVNFTAGGQGTITQTSTIWHAPGVGKVKEVISVQVDSGPVLTALTEELEGYVVNGQGSGLRIEVNPASISMRVGEDKTLQVAAFDLRNSQVVGLPFTWLSTDPAVATIGSDATLSGKGLGTATVTASLGGLKSNSVAVTVSDVKIVPLATNDLAYDSVSGRLYASLPGTQGRIATIDPLTGSVGSSPVIGNDPNRLAISDDGQFLYVSIDNENAVQRLTLPLLATNLNFSLGSPPPSTPQEYICAKQMKVVPGNARAVVVARTRHLASGSCAFNEPYETAVFQDGIELSNKITGQSVRLLEFSDVPSLLFGVSTFSPGSLSRISVTASGLSLIDSNNLTNWPGRDFKFLNGLIYAANGDVINAATYSMVGSFTNAGAFSLRPDGNSKRLFAVSGDLDETLATIRVFDTNTLALIGSLDIPKLGIPAIPQYIRYTGLVRWGVDGLAFRTSSNEVVIIRSPLVSP